MSIKRKWLKLTGRWDTPLDDFVRDLLPALEAWHRERSKHDGQVVRYRDTAGWAVSDSGVTPRIQDLNNAAGRLYDLTTPYMAQKRHLEEKADE